MYFEQISLFVVFPFNVTILSDSILFSCPFLQAYAGFKKMTGFCKTHVPQSLADSLEAIKVGEGEGERACVYMCVCNLFVFAYKYCSLGEAFPPFIPNSTFFPPFSLTQPHFPAPFPTPLHRTTQRQSRRLASTLASRCASSLSRRARQACTSTP